MQRRRVMNWAVGFGLAMFVWTAASPAADSTGVPDAARQRKLIDLLKQDCGACHGLYLSGGLGPGLRAQDLRGKPVEALSEVILKGRPGTPMPGWQAFLSESEAGWMVETLLKGIADDR